MGRSINRFMSRHFWIVFGGIWFIVGLPFLLIGVGVFYNQSRYSAEAMLAEAVVLGKDLKRATVERGTEYWVRYRLTTPDGQILENNQEVDFNLWERLQEMGPVEVEYLPGDPGSIHIAGQDDWVLPWVFTSLGAVFTFVGGGLLIWSFQKISTANRLLRRGYLTEAVVESVGPANMTVNRERQWQIRYRYRDQMGIEHEGKSPYLSPAEASQWKVGDAGEVRYDPQKTSVSVWVEQEELRGP